jgi:hypothetical protein
MVRKEKSAATAFVESAERVEWVEVVLRNGMTYQGNVLRNPIRRTGAIVNALDETRHDFSLDDVQSVRRVCDPRLDPNEVAPIQLPIASRVGPTVTTQLDPRTAGLS